jgi:predicted nuclease of restriction endonuclease-like (RecB) superfamily
MDKTKSKLSEPISSETSKNSMAFQYQKSDNITQDIVTLIQSAKGHVAREYNSTQVYLAWFIGKRIEDELLQHKRADYGEKLIESIAETLSQQYGSGYTRSSIFRMIKFYRYFSDERIVSTLSRQLSWSHFILICTMQDELKRTFYAEMCRVQKWSVRGLKQQIDSMLYERTALSKSQSDVINAQLKDLQSEDKITPELVFKDPYFIEFTSGKSYLSEADLETAILDNITTFLQELGSDFCFVARQKRMSTGKKDRYLDLLFFNRRLMRLIAIELKLGDFDPAYKGQMEWYLNWLNEHERLPHEAKPLGIILCAGKDHEDIQYLELDKTGIHVAQYLTELPAQDVLEKKLKHAIALAQEKITNLQGNSDYLTILGEE